MTEKIRPALTPEEWRQESFSEGERDGDPEDGDYGVCVDITPCSDDPRPVLTVEVLEAELIERDLPEEHVAWTLKDRRDFYRRHALAALALYGQPFGFTREDVAMLRVVARLHPQASNLVIGTAATPEVAASLADRIEALLPPE